MFNLDDCIAFITARSAKTFVKALERRFRPYEISRIQWIALYYIYTGNAITQRGLADKMSVKEPTVVRLLQEMEQDGLVTRSGSDTDKRVRFPSLTEKGERICTELIPVVEKFKNDTIAGISREDLDVLTRTLGKMVENAQKKNN
ncbi:MAG: MarR family winged helix-turn-helix transcriptional regulator [Oscillospiraceae bacterium]